MKSKNTIILMLILIISSLAYSHCQIPCGIFDDEMNQVNERTCCYN